MSLHQMKNLISRALKSKMFVFCVIFVVASFVTVLAGDAIFKDGTLSVDSLDVTEDIAIENDLTVGSSNEFIFDESTATFSAAYLISTYDLDASNNVECDSLSVTGSGTTSFSSGIDLGGDLQATSGSVKTNGLEFYDDGNNEISVTGHLVTVNGNYFTVGSSSTPWKAGYFAEAYVDDLLKIAANSSSMTCDGNNEGAIYYNGDTNKHYGCDGSSWNALY